MKLDFDLQSVITTEFGVGREDGDDQTFIFIPVDGDVQLALREMSQATWNAMHDQMAELAKYDPSEKYASTECVYLPLNDDLAKRMRDLHMASNLPTNVNALQKPTEMFCYFARFTDRQGRRLTALRRATQFKGVLKSRLLRLVSDALRLVDEKVFKLDVDFDLLIDSENAYIHRPSAFEFVGQLQSAVLAAAPINIKALNKELTFVDFGAIQDYASRHPRAARYLASIRTQKETKNIDKRKLKSLCKSTGVEIKESNGKICVEESSIMGFLEVLDRRRYEIQLVKDSPERYRASSRQKLGNTGGGSA